MSESISRRSMLASLGVGASALSFGAFHSPVHAAEAERSEAKGVPEMSSVELAIATICVDGFGDENFEPSFELIPQLGFKNVEFNCWYPRNLTPAGIESIKSRCEERGLKPISVQGSSFGDGGPVDVAHKLWCMHAARELGCHRVKFTGSRRGSQGGLPAIIGALKELAPAAEEMRVLICVENHAGNNLETIEDYEQIFAAIDSPNVGLCLDTGHFDGSGIDIAEVVRRFHSRTNHVDLKDCQEKGKYKTVNFGDGITDLHGTIESLLEHCYTGYLVVEQAPPIRPAMLKEDLTAAYEMFRRYEE